MSSHVADASARKVPHSDAPIADEREDRLERRASAQAFVHGLLQLDATEGAVVGVLGAWGSGKTSFVNMARPYLVNESWTVLEFNPWMFSGVGQLVDAFFSEIAAQLSTHSKFDAIAKGLSEYGEVFTSIGSLPVIGPWAKVAGAVGRQLRREARKRQAGGVSEPRDVVSGLLADLDRPIAVVIDDIDRLPTDDIRDVFRLVRLTGSFPNLVYILEFDRARVEKALTEDGVPGREYLEKILFWTMDLPAIRPETLASETLVALDEALSDLDIGPFDAERWADVYPEIVRPLIRQMRDVRRYAASVRATATELGASVSLVDTLALEAIRVFLPDTFALLAKSVAHLTSPSGVLAGTVDSGESRAAVTRLLEADAPNQAVLEALIHRIFPAAERFLPRGSHYGPEWSSIWLRGRRVAHADLLRLYLERIAGESLIAFVAAERTVAVLGDAGALASTFSEMDAGERSRVIAALETWEDEFAPEAVIPASSVLLSLLPDVAEGGGGMLALRPSTVVGRVVLRLLRRLPNAAARLIATTEILSRVASLSSQLDLIRLVGHRDNVGHKLVEEADANTLERSWRDRVRGADAESLLHEWDLLRVFYAARSEAGADEEPVGVPDSAALVRAFLGSSAGIARRQSIGNRAVKLSTHLAWDPLVAVFGSEEELRSRLEAARQAASEDEIGLFELADRYLSGWRPSGFED